MTRPGSLDFAAWRDRVLQRIAREHQRPTPQRMLVAETLFHHGHLNVDELHREVRLIDPSLGYATVYRTLKLFERCGLVHTSNFGDGTARYEIDLDGHDHHDHMICTECNKIIEFEEPRIEALQEEVARKHGFTLQSHRMDLFGLCLECASRA